MFGKSKFGQMNKKKKKKKKKRIKMKFGIF